MTRTARKLTPLRESTRADGSSSAPGVLRDCKILGFDSSRGRRYTPEAVRGAAALYEGAAVFLDHPAEGDAKTRSVRDKFGWFENVRFVDGDGIRGDFHWNRGHDFAPAFEGWVASAPNQIGFSHNAFTDPTRNRTDPDGTAVITNIAEVASVDLVSRGATTQGLRESHMEPHDDIDTPAAPAPEPAPAGEGYEEHLANLVKSVMTDKGLDKASRRKKLLKALDLCDDEKVEAPVEESEEEEPKDKGDKPILEGDDEEEKKVEEAARLAAKDPRLKPLLESHDRLKTGKRLAVLEGKCRDMCVTAKLPLKSITGVFVQTLMEARDDRARHALIEDRRALGAAGPKSHAPSGAAGRKITADDILAGVTAD